jgi:histidinol-phosphate phosphatase family protein
VKPPGVSVVVPTVGRSSLAALLERLAAEDGTFDEVVVVDDRDDADRPLDVAAAGAVPLRVLRSGGRGPAAARNVGWRAASSPWVAFLDDDVLPEPGWGPALLADLAACGDDVAASQGRVMVPLPAHRRPTDWERGTAGLATARWITADLAYRRSVLAEVQGFDERFRRAYREDADLGLRVTAAGYRIATGSRRVLHPVRTAPWHASAGAQRGNADDPLMDALHGPGWRERADAPRGRRRRHVAVTAAGGVALAGLVGGRRRLAGETAVAWLAGTASFAWQRIAPGPRTAGEVAAMAATSVVIPPLAVGWWVVGRVRARRLRRGGPVGAVLFDRDGTLVVDVPYNADPGRVVPVPGARAALDRLRAAGIPLGVVTNQSAVARGLATVEQVAAVNRRVDELLGPFAAIEVCPHGPGDGCRCRKPAPGMVLRVAAALGVDLRRCVVIGDIGADVDAARAAGARPILVPTPVTRRHEVRAAPEVARDLARAVDRVLGAGGRRPR